MIQLAFGLLLVAGLIGSLIAAFATGDLEFLAIAGFCVLLLRGS